MVKMEITINFDAPKMSVQMSAKGEEAHPAEFQLSQMISQAVGGLIKQGSKTPEDYSATSAIRFFPSRSNPL
jgi:hypothetical protein